MPDRLEVAIDDLDTARNVRRSLGNLDDLPDDERVLGTLIENLLRDDLDPVEEATGYQLLIDSGWNQKRIAERRHRSKGHVSKRRRLLALPPEVQEMVTNGTIPTDHGYKLGRLANQGLADAAAITDLASRNMYYTEAAINKASAGIAAENRIRELTNKGLAVIDMDQFRTSNYTALTWMEVDSRAHTKEPCHRGSRRPHRARHRQRTESLHGPRTAQSRRRLRTQRDRPQRSVGGAASRAAGAARTRTRRRQPRQDRPRPPAGRGRRRHRHRHRPPSPRIREPAAPTRRRPAATPPRHLRPRRPRLGVPTRGHREGGTRRPRPGVHPGSLHR